MNKLKTSYLALAAAIAFSGNAYATLATVTTTDRIATTTTVTDVNTVVVPTPAPIYTAAPTTPPPTVPQPGAKPADPKADPAKPITYNPKSDGDKKDIFEKICEVKKITCKSAVKAGEVGTLTCSDGKTNIFHIEITKKQGETLDQSLLKILEQYKKDLSDSDKSKCKTYNVEVQRAAEPGKPAPKPITVGLPGLPKP